MATWQPFQSVVFQSEKTRHMAGSIRRQKPKGFRAYTRSVMYRRVPGSLVIAIRILEILRSIATITLTKPTHVQVFSFPEIGGRISPSALLASVALAADRIAAAAGEPASHAGSNLLYSKLKSRPRKRPGPASKLGSGNVGAIQQNTPGVSTSRRVLIERLSPESPDPQSHSRQDRRG